jgi:hypothetical protein
MRYAYAWMVIKSQGKKSRGSLAHKWEVNIEMDLKGILCEGVDWIVLVRDSGRVLCERCNEPVIQYMHSVLVEYWAVVQVDR